MFNRGRLASTKADNFQKMVVCVALIYCTCQLMNVYGHAKIVFLHLKSGNTEKVLPYDGYETILNEVLNSSVNLFVYIAASTKFRKDFCKYVLLR